jgi:hypothetical protein
MGRPEQLVQQVVNILIEKENGRRPLALKFVYQDTSASHIHEETDKGILAPGTRGDFLG